MTNQCLYCGEDIIDWRKATVLFEKPIHKRCLKEMKQRADKMRENRKEGELIL